MAQSQGLLIKDADGNIYFLRPEILEAAKVSQAEIQSAPTDWKKHVDVLHGKGDVSGYAKQAAIQSLGALRVNVASPSGDWWPTKSTLMCPW